MKIIQLICQQCGRQYDADAYHIRKDRKFCNKACANEAKNTQDPMALLLSKCDKQENGCWTYTGFKGDGGYGQIGVRGVHHLAHRLMWELWNKQVAPSELVVRHTCIGNPACINPEHLILGTQKQNIQDCIDQGRFKPSARGSKNSNAKLTEEAVVKMKSLRNPTDGSKPVPFRVISEQFGVSYSAAYMAIKGTQWTHVK